MSKRILIIDDDEMLLEVFQGFLEDIGHSHLVLRASQTKEAIRLFEETKPDLVIMDVIMPGVDGLQLLAQFKKSGHVFKSIMLSGLSDEKCRKKAESLGADQYFTKPVNLEVFKKVIQKMFAA